MAKKQFKSESKQLLNLMINSIYTHREIFLRELISNASDAIDKLNYKAITEGDIPLSKEDFRIRVSYDKEARTVTVSDNGIGMNDEEMEKNLGVIAHSGSLDFKKTVESEDVDIIGQFGVGFYSSFLVADEVTVVSKPYGSDKAWEWKSQGADGYTIRECGKETWGTDITLHLKADDQRIVGTFASSVLIHLLAAQRRLKSTYYPTHIVRMNALGSSSIQRSQTSVQSCCSLLLSLARKLGPQLAILADAVEGIILEQGLDI